MPDSSYNENKTTTLKRAYLQLEELQTKLKAAQGAQREPIAVVGMGCRFPGDVHHADAFWDLIIHGVDAVTEVPPDRWDADAYYDPDPDAPGKMVTRWGGFLKKIDQFEPQLFGISPREAISMDPQQRLLLEVVWEALEDAGQAPDTLKGSQTGVFIGIIGSEYAQLQTAGDGLNHIDTYFGSGVANSIASGRISYVLGLQGPSLSIDTACSSSLVAVHLACQSLRSRECRMALAGGVNLMLLPDTTIILTKHRLMAADGRCKTFDQAADGYVRGEGCGIVVLKRLADAVADCDRILGLIRGTAANQDGPSSGLTAPHGPSQQAVIRAALKNAGIKPAEVGYIETHGTGTSLGDPIEVQALSSVLQEGRPPGTPVYIGAIKANIGHLEAAAGIASFIKTLLMLRYKEIPPHLHMNSPNPHIPWDRLPVAVTRKRIPWPPSYPRIAGVSSFGFSGTNAHMVLEAYEPEKREPIPIDRPQHLLVLSARTEKALSDLAGRYARHLHQSSDLSLADVCFSANTGRAMLPRRLAIAADTIDKLRDGLKSAAADLSAPGFFHGECDVSEPPKIAFLFSDQNAQYVNMGRQLYDTQSAFRDVINQCRDILGSLQGGDLLSLLYPKDSKPSDAGLKIHPATYAHPALFAVECALLALWRSWGIVPTAVLGHGVGEFAAAVAAGALSLEDGMRFVTECARMVSAPTEQDFLEKLLTTVTFSDPRVHLISTDTAKPLKQDELSAPSYWRCHLRSPESFQTAFQTLCGMGYRAFVEVSPDPVLRGLAAHRLPADSVAWLPSLRRGHNDWQELLDSLSQLFVKGARIDWSGFDLPYGRRRLSLPIYPFLRERFWPNLPLPKPKIQRAGKAIHPLLGYRLLSALPDLQFETSLSGDDFGFVNDHQVNGMTLLPATAFIEMASAGGKAVCVTEAFSLEDFIIHRPLIFDRGKARVVQTIISPCPEGDYSFKICSRAQVDGQSAELAFSGEALWTIHVTGRIQKAGGKADGSTASNSDLKTLLDRCSEEISGSAHYEELARRGFQFGPALQGVSLIKRGTQEALGRIRLPEMHGQAQAGFGFHPALLDACLQFFWTILPEGSKTESYLPMSFERFRVHSAPGTEIWSYISGRPAPGGDPGRVEGDVRIYNTSGRLVAALDKLSFRKADRSALLESRLPGIRDWFYRLEWEPAAGSASTQSDPGVDATGPGNFILPLDQIAEHVEHSMSSLCEAEDLVSHHRLVSEIEALSCAYAAEALEKLGLNYHPGRRYSEESFSQDAKIERRYRRLLHRLLQILAEEGMLRQVEGGWEVVRNRAGDDSRSRLEKLLSRPEARSSAQLELVNRCGQKLAQALTGQADPLALLFPNGSLALAARLYSESPEARVFNSLVREAVGNALGALPPGRKARILELGAGTGGATSFVLPGLHPDQTEYVFTDISPVFLKQAAERFKDYPFVTYRLCNIERGPEEQSFDTNTFDIVIAMNMLHATRDLKQSLANVYKFLTPGGILILLEGTAPERWIDVTFGLTDGWWAFTDAGLRPDYPLLSREMWCTVLRDAGFMDTRTTPEPTGLSTEALVIARKPVNGAEITARGRSSGGRWMVLLDAFDLGRRLADGLEALGFDCLRVSSGDHFEQKGANEWSVRFDQLEDFQRLFADASSEGGRNLGHIVHLSSINAEISDDAGIAAMEQSQTFVSRSLLFFLQALLKSCNGSVMPDLTIVTRGAQPANSTHSVAVAQAPVWGVSKAVGLEHPDLAWRCIDLDPGASAGQNVRCLISELIAPNPENMIAVREGRTWVPRLKRAGDLVSPNRGTVVPDDTISLRLEKSENGILAELTLAPSEYKEPGPGTVQIRVHAAGLSFRDVMNALSMRDDPEPLGSECSGRITKVGKGVRGFSIGDAVIALASGSMGTTVNAQAEFVLPKPESLSFEEAATLPTAFLTTHYALNHLGKIRKGEKVLIHAAAGGVGMAAVQLALAAEAEVIGTAGSEAKRAYLRSLGLQQVMDSRTTAFAEEIMAVTGGKGVDVVLNSLSGDFITNSLSALGANGRFLEIGKRDILTSEEMQRLRPDVVYHVVDLAATSYENPPLIRKLFEQVMSLVEHGKIKPLPLRVFPLTEAEVAFRYMSQSKHIGKVVIKNERSRDDAPIICSDATYLVTGGLSGLGLVVGEWLAEKGAKHLALMARSAVGQAVLEKIVALEQKGVSVRTFQADVSVTEQVDRCLREIADRMPPLRGIIHSAGVLADGVLLNQTWDQYDAVYRPKIYGAWNLHRLTKALDLDFFVLFSSAAGLFGSAGQSNHSAANAFLDALAHYRRQQGLPALSINWGVWAEIGAAAQRKADERMVFQGIGAIPPQLGIKALETVLPSKAAQIAVVPVDWEVMLEKYGGAHTPPWLSGMRRPKYVFEHAPVNVQDLATATPNSVLAELVRTPAGKRRKALIKVVQELTARVIGVRNPSEIDPARPLSEQGVDSLMAVELRNMLGKEMGLKRGFPATLVFDYPTIEKIAAFLFERTLSEETSLAPASAAEGQTSHDLIDAIGRLSDEDADRLLKQQEGGL